MPEVTKHAASRMGERNGIPKRSADRMAEIALEKGMRHGEMTGRLKKWADGQYLCERTANNMRLYGETLYIFHNQTLITVIPVPNNLKKQAIEQAKKARADNA